MKITAQEEYGLRCLIRLARAYGEQPLTIPEVAAAENLSPPYVAKLLSVLRQAGLIESVRGRTGGYHLARPPAEVRLGVVLLALGEPLFEEPVTASATPARRPRGRASIREAVRCGHCGSAGPLDASRSGSGDAGGPAGERGADRGSAPHRAADDGGTAEAPLLTLAPLIRE